MIYKFKGFIPVVHPSSFIHPQATVTGNVIIGKDVYIAPGACLRGDWGAIVIKDGCNVQENCTIHMFPGTTVTLHEGAHVGHGAVIHGATLGKNCMIGMNTVVMDDSVIGENAIIGAMSFVKAKTTVPANSLAVGNPAKVVKKLTPEMIAWKTKGTSLYQQLPADLHETLKQCDPLTEMPADRPNQEVLFETWEKIKNS